VPRLRMGARWIGESEPCYFIADIGANHDGDLKRAKTLIRLAAQAGADAVKFQNFIAPKIVSKVGFNAMKAPLAHQAAWRKSVYEIYSDASAPWDWTATLKKTCDEVGVTYLSTPYDLDAVDMLNPFVPAFKIGSGDITWPEILLKAASKGKPLILSTGASNLEDVRRAVNVLGTLDTPLVLLQCNTNYTGSRENLKFVNLRVMSTYRTLFPEAVVGLSDHSPGDIAAIGAVALGAKVIEKHFTDDNHRIGPDHSFAMTPTAWKAMMERTRDLELAFGVPEKKVEENERETAIVQRRCLRAAQDLPAGTVLTRESIDVLRPAPAGGISPHDIDRILLARLKKPVIAGEHFRWEMLELKER